MTLPEIIAFVTGPALPLLAAGWAVKAALTYAVYRVWLRRRAARMLRLAGVQRGAVLPGPEG